MYRKWTEDHGYLERNTSMFRQKFDRLAGERKPTGVSLCPSLVRHAKKIAQDIQAKAVSGSLGFDTTNNTNELYTDTTRLYCESNVPLGARNDSRRPTTNGFKRQKICDT